MAEETPKRSKRTNMKNMTEEERLEHVRTKYREHAITWRAKHPEYLTERIQCECGVSYKRRNKSKHNKTAKHCAITTLLERLRAQTA